MMVVSGVLPGERTEGEAARLLKRRVRQIRRIQWRLEAEGDADAMGAGCLTVGLIGPFGVRCSSCMVGTTRILVRRWRPGLTMARRNLCNQVQAVSMPATGVARGSMP